MGNGKSTIIEPYTGGPGSPSPSVARRRADDGTGGAGADADAGDNAVGFAPDGFRSTSSNGILGEAVTPMTLNTSGGQLIGGSGEVQQSAPIITPATTVSEEPLSSTTQSPFVFDGRHYASAEAFWNNQQNLTEDERGLLAHLVASGLNLQGSPDAFEDSYDDDDLKTARSAMSAADGKHADDPSTAAAAAAAAVVDEAPAAAAVPAAAAPAQRVAAAPTVPAVSRRGSSHAAQRGDVYHSADVVDDDMGNTEYHDHAQDAEHEQDYAAYDDEYHGDEEEEEDEDEDDDMEDEDEYEDARDGGSSAHMQTPATTNGSFVSPTGSVPASVTSQEAKVVDEMAPLERAQYELDKYVGPAAAANGYRLLRSIGRGAYGAVYVAIGPNGDHVAIKHILGAFTSVTHARRIFREVCVMDHFKHPNVMAMYSVLRPCDPNGFEDMYVVTELMESDLHKVIRSSQTLTSDHIAFLLYQLLCALKHLHSAGVLHRDLKPSNLLVNSDCALKVADFGLARETAQSLSAALTEYVVTRWYRAPEVLLSVGEYTEALDVWAAGCIFAELLMRRPLFPGNSYLHQLQLITRILGSPSEEDLHFVTTKAARDFMLRQPYQPGIDFADMCPYADACSLDLARKMVTLDPAKRITLDEALAHPFLADVRERAAATPATGGAGAGAGAGSATAAATLRDQVEATAPPLKMRFKLRKADLPTLRKRFLSDLCPPANSAKVARRFVVPPHTPGGSVNPDYQHSPLTSPMAGSVPTVSAPPARRPNPRRSSGKPPTPTQVAGGGAASQRRSSPRYGLGATGGMDDSPMSRVSTPSEIAVTAATPGLNASGSFTVATAGSGSNRRMSPGAPAAAAVPRMPSRSPVHDPAADIDMTPPSSPGMQLPGQPPPPSDSPPRRQFSNSSANQKRSRQARRSSQPHDERAAAQLMSPTSPLETPTTAQPVRKRPHRRTPSGNDAAGSRAARYAGQAEDEHKASPASHGSAGSGGSRRPPPSHAPPAGPAYRERLLSTSSDIDVTAGTQVPNPRAALQPSHSAVDVTAARSYR